MSRFLFIAIAIGIIYILLKGDKKKKSERRDKEEDRLKASGDLVKDPICGSFVDKDGHIRVRDGEHVYQFCSYECRDKFLKQLGQSKPVEAAAPETRESASAEDADDAKE